MTLRVDIEPELLAWACDRAGKSPVDLELRFPKLSAWFTGDQRPTLKQIESFAKATHTPVGYLFLQKPPDERLPIPDLRTMGGARTNRPSPDLLETVYTCERRQEWYRGYALSEGEEPLPYVGSATIESDVRAVAKQIGRTLVFGVGDRSRASTWADALRHFVRHAEAAGVLVMISGIVGSDTHRRLRPEEFRGFALVDTLAPLVFVNGADTKAAQMFTLAHELAHVWLGQAALSDIRPGVASPHQVERWCNAVAAEMLVPLPDLRAQFDHANDLHAEIRRLAAHFKVSTLVVIRRLQDVDAVSEDSMWRIYQSELKRLKELGKRKSSGGDFYRTQGARLGRRFAMALVHSTRSGRTLYRDAFRLSGCRQRATFDTLAETLGATP